jgi:hypothetical protein
MRAPGGWLTLRSGVWLPRRIREWCAVAAGIGSARPVEAWLACDGSVGWAWVHYL